MSARNVSISGTRVQGSSAAGALPSKTPGPAGRNEMSASNSVCPVTDFPPGTRNGVLKATKAFLLEWESIKTKPYWPGGQSGVTWGVGWDAGQHTKTQLTETWRQLDAEDLDVLAPTAKLIGNIARDYLTETQALRQITVPEEVSRDVFSNAISGIYDNSLPVTFPGGYCLPQGAQTALISLIYNRGTSMYDSTNKARSDSFKDSRYEMRLVKKAVQKRDINGIYDAIRAMERLWRGTEIERGMTNRRESEASLLLPYLPMDIRSDTVPIFA